MINVKFCRSIVDIYSTTIYNVSMSNKSLSLLGFSDREIEIYTTLLELGPTKPTDLAKALKINRTTLYGLSKKLASRGLVSEDISGPTIKLVANDPKSLTELLNQERDQLASKEILIKDAITDLSLISKRATHPVPKIQFITEDKIVKYIYGQSQKWQDSTAKYDHTWWGFQDHVFAERYEYLVNWFWKNIMGDQGKVKLFSNASAAVEQKLKKQYPRRFIKTLDDPNQFTSTIWIVGDYVVMFFLKDSPNYLVEIHDATLAQNMRAVFSHLWNRVPD